jgi:hypothetical protein
MTVRDSLASVSRIIIGKLPPSEVTPIPMAARGDPGPEVNVIREGWCVKESGNTFMGQHNWRRRWFLLAQKGSEVTLSYYKNKTDEVPAGSVRLDKTCKSLTY